MQAVEAYDMLRKALVDQTDSVIKRMTILVTGNSILVAGFFLAYDTQYFSLISYWLPAVGIVFSVVFGIVMGVGAHLTIKLADRLAELEQEPEFDYLKNHAARLELDITGWTSKRGIRHKVGCWLSPAISAGPIVIWALILLAG
jgi:hypothetical protein